MCDYYYVGLQNYYGMLLYFINKLLYIRESVKIELEINKMFNYGFKLQSILIKFFFCLN